MSSELPHKLPLTLLAAGAFAVGTDTFVISGVLPDISGSLHVSAAVTGQLVTAFALTYALSAPVMAALTARIPRKTLLAASMVLFVLSNVLGAVAPDYPVMIVARIVAGVAAGLYIPTAIVIASSMAAAEVRGRSIALVAGGMTVATALGVPIGTLVGAVGNWRLTLLLVAAVALLALIGVLMWLPAVPQPPMVPLRRRLQVGFRPVLLQAFGANVLACAGIFAMFTYIAPLTQATTTWGGSGVSAVLLAWGVAAVGGSAVGGRLSDRFNGNVSFTVSVVSLIVSLAGLGAVVSFGSRYSVFNGIALVVLVVIASVACWSLPPAQNHRVAGLAPEAPAVALSLNSSSSYLGFSVGGALGGATVSGLSIHALSWVGAGIEVVALAAVGLGTLVVTSGRRASAVTEPA